MGSTGSAAQLIFTTGNLTRTNSAGQTFAPPAETTRQPGANNTTASATVVSDNNSRSPTGIPGFTPGETGYDTVFLKVALHESGHTMGLGHPPLPPPGTNCDGQVRGDTVMNNVCNINDQANNMPTDVTTCDQNTVRNMPNYSATPTPTPAETNPTPARCENQGEAYACSADFGRWRGYPICECFYSPVLIDLDGDGFALTSGADGVNFDLNNDGSPERIAWTLAGADDGWLFLDRNGNGLVDNGAELFGNLTPQAASEEPNGFRALAEFDQPGRGGDGDGWITSSDAVFASLRVWRDADHDGLSGASELSGLSELSLERIELAYKTSRRVDEHGNEFRYRAKIDSGKGGAAGRWAWDVFLVSVR